MLRKRNAASRQPSRSVQLSDIIEASQEMEIRVEKRRLLSRKPLVRKDKSYISQLFSTAGQIGQVYPGTKATTESLIKVPERTIRR